MQSKPLLDNDISVLARRASPAASTNQSTDVPRDVRLSEERFRLAASNDSLTLYEADADLRYTWLYPARPHQIDALGKTDIELLSPKQASRLTALKRRVMETGDRAEHEVSATRHGSTHFYHLTITPRYGPDGAVIGVAGSALDITDRKIAEKALAQSEQRFRATFNQAAVGIGIASVDGVLLEVNQKFCEILGYPASELLGRTVTELTLAEDIPRTHDTIHRLKNGRSSHVAYEKRFLTKYGGFVWVRSTVSLTRDSSGAPDRFIGVIEDISQRKKAEEALEALSLELQLVLDTSATGLTHCSRDLRYISVNKTHAQLIGVPLGQIIGRPIIDVIGSSAFDSIKPYIDSVLAGQRVEYEKEVAFPLGGIRHLHVVYTPVKDSHARVSGWIASVTDITDRKKAEHALIEAQGQLREHAASLEQTVAARTAELEQRVAELQAFSYSLSHDFRAPLRTIQAFSQCVLEDAGPLLPEESKAYLEKVSAAASRLDRLIQDVLLFTRISQKEIAVSDINLEALITELCSERIELQPPRAEIRLERPLLSVRGDRASLTQCLINLLGNAAKFVAPGVQAQIIVSTEPRGSLTRIWVKDNGVGIRPQDLPRLFQVFSRGEGAASYDGSGLGLAIVRRAAERMGGSVGVESTRGNGSRFWLDLPCGPQGLEFHP